MNARIWPRVVPVNSLDDVQDSIEASGGVSRAYRYCHGNGKPHYPLPAIIYDVYHQVDFKNGTEIWMRTGTQSAYCKRVFAYFVNR